MLILRILGGCCVLLIVFVGKFFNVLMFICFYVYNIFNLVGDWLEFKCKLKWNL